MFEGLKKMFSGNEEGAVKLGVESNEQMKTLLKVNAFSKLFPDVLFDEVNIGSIIEKARLSEEEVDRIMFWSEQGVDDITEQEFDNIRDRIVTASLIEEPLI